jgi:hypothetical protein
VENCALFGPLNVGWMLCFQLVFMKQVVDFLLRIFMFYDLVGVNYLSLSLKPGYYIARF